MTLSPRAQAVAGRTPKDVKKAWAAAFRGPEPHGETTSEQRALIADWVTETILHSRLPNPLMEEMWPPSFGHLRHNEADVFRI